MPPSSIYNSFVQAKATGTKQLAVLIDPDQVRTQQLSQLLRLAQKTPIDYFFVGGSLLFQDHLNECMHLIQSSSDTPIILFPGNPLQIHPKADAILLLSLISGRNSELLIGQHVIAAPYLKAAALETIATGYMLIDGGKPTSVSYISNTNPIPSEKTEIAVCTALAGEMLGLKAIYLDAGSGAKYPVPAEMIRQVKQNTTIPLMVGGGLRSTIQVETALNAGADLVVVGAALETNPNLLPEISQTVKSFS